MDAQGMSDAITTIGSLKDAVRAFAEARQWGPYHTPKNLSMALAAEAAELMEHFLWLTGEESQQSCNDPSKREAIADELADIMNLVCQFSIHSGIDISEAVKRKMQKNELKYPKEVSRS
jgi:NTP pyrophosphatase (non-canonical NTP hydrolase)